LRIEPLPLGTPDEPVCPPEWHDRWFSSLLFRADFACDRLCIVCFGMSAAA
jgi:hypothetical protein